MPGPTLLMHAASWAQALPPAALTAAGRWRVPGRRWAALANLLYVGADFLRLLLSRQGVNNLWVGYLATPLGGALVLLALSCWQQTTQAAWAIRGLIPVYLLIWGGLLLFEDLGSHSLVVFPVDSLLVLVLCLWTLIRNAMVERVEPIWKSDWFWVAGGMALAVGAASSTGPLLRRLIANQQDALAFTVVEAKAGFDLAAVLMITIGMLCPVPTTPSGPSSSPAR